MASILQYHIMYYNIISNVISKIYFLMLFTNKLNCVIGENYEKRNVNMTLYLKI